MLITSNDTLEGGTYQYFEFDCLCCASLPSLSRRPVGLGRREIRGDILSGRAHRRRLNETRIMERTKNQNAWIFRHKDEWRKESRGNLEREIKIRATTECFYWELMDLFSSWSTRNRVAPTTTPSPLDGGCGISYCSGYWTSYLRGFTH